IVAHYHLITFCQPVMAHQRPVIIITLTDGEGGIVCLILQNKHLPIENRSTISVQINKAEKLREQMSLPREQGLQGRQKAIYRCKGLLRCEMRLPLSAQVLLSAPSLVW